MNTESQTTTYKKPKGKCVPYTIDSTVRNRIKSFRKILQDLVDYGEATPRQAAAIDVVLNKLDDYDSNLILAYFEYGNQPSVLSQMLGVSQSVIVTKVKKIKKKILEHVNNDYQFDTDPVDTGIFN